MSEFSKEYQDILDKEDRERIMAMQPRDMTLPEFLVFKRVLHTVDLSRRWNLNTTRDCHIATVAKITAAMNEWASIKSSEAIFFYIAQQQ